MATLILKNRSIKITESFDQVHSIINTQYDNTSRKFLEFTTIYESGFGLDEPECSKVLINLNKIIEVRQ